MFLSSVGGPTIVTPINSAIGAGETKVLQAQLGNNLASATLVAGNANTVLDTIGTGDWKFYVAGGNSIAEISSASNSTEWTGGSIIPYVPPPILPTDMSFCFTLNTNAVSGTTISSSVGGYTGTLYTGDSISNALASIGTDGSPGPGQGYLSLTKVVGSSSGYAVLPVLTFTTFGLTISTWFRATANNLNFSRIFDMFPFTIYIAASPDGIGFNGGGISNKYMYTGTVRDNVWRHLVLTITNSGASSAYTFYINGIFQQTRVGNYLTFPGSYQQSTIGTVRSFNGSGGAESYDGGIDDFRVYHRPITASEVYLIYSQPATYYPFKTADINGSTPTLIGDLSTGTYVYNGTLVGTASIVANANSRVSGKAYLSLTPTSSYFKIVPFGVVTSGFSIAFWGRFTSSTPVGGGRIFDMRGTNGEISLQRSAGTGAANTVFNMFVTGPGTVLSSGSVFDGVWRHYAVTITYDSVGAGASSVYKLYTNGTETATATKAYPGLGTRTAYNIGTYGDTGDSGMDGGIDDFRIYHRPLTQTDVTNLYAGSSSAKITDSTTGATWIAKPGVAVDSTETSYTVKSNEIALAPGTNSTYAVWTSPKPTNIRVDVSFADYHSRSAGVGFQMFKINSDNTFGSVIFPRTVTSTALTNANPTNYLSVPSRTISVATGDKIYYRVDANGNTTAASSVLATNIYADNNYIPPLSATNVNETKLLQANLGNNLASATTLVAGNANVVYDTVGNGDWKFYVAGNTSTAAITSTSASSEWTGGNLLSYVPPPQPAPTNYNLYYPINVPDINPSNPLQVGEYSTGSYLYNGTLVNGATISTDSGARVAGQGYLKITNISQSLIFSSFTTGSSGISFSLWARVTNKYEYIKFFDVGREGSVTLVQLQGDTLMARVNNSNVSGIYTGGPITDGVWKHYVFVMTPASSGTWKTYLNGEINTTLTNVGYPTARTRTQNYIFNYSQGTGNSVIDVGVDDFQFFNRELSASEVYNIYASGQPQKLTNATTGTTWVTTPAVPVNSSETSYTVKSNEIALAPGTNSTYAVWTAPKTTNLKIDVSFADYHSRSAGVGFQMFKINNDNTFGSVIFPRTVTSTALTNANPTNYLSVPSRSLSVSTGDKIYYRIDANGNTTAASSVLATNIYSYSGVWS